MSEQLGFIDIGQRNKFPFDLLDLSLYNDSDKVEIIRHVQFFCAGQILTIGKMREFFTNKAIELYEHDGFIKITEV